MTKYVFMFLVLFVFCSAGVAVEVAIGDSTSTDKQVHPFSIGYVLNRSAALYLKDEINAQGYITKIQFDCTKALPNRPFEHKMYAKLTSQSSLSTEYWDSLRVNTTLIYEGNHDFDQTGWWDFNINNFYYDNSDNLLLIFDSSQSENSYNTVQWRATDTSPDSLFCGRTSQSSSSTLRRIKYRPNIILTIQDINTPTISIIMDDENRPRITWDPVNGATGYNIYSSHDPYDGEGGWTLLDSVLEPEYTYDGDDSKRFFRVRTIKTEE